MHFYISLGIGVGRSTFSLFICHNNENIELHAERAEELG